MSFAALLRLGPSSLMLGGPSASARPFDPTLLLGDEERSLVRIPCDTSLGDEAEVADFAPEQHAVL